MEVLGDHVSETEYEVCATPVPDIEITIGEFVALLVTVMLPAAFPAAEGSNVALKVAVCPADKINPWTAPLALNPAPATTTFEIVTLEFPELVSITFWVLVLETLTLPKAKLAELLFRRDVAAAFTVRMAALLVALPALSLTTTVNFVAFSDVVVAGVV